MLRLVMILLLSCGLSTYSPVAAETVTLHVSTGEALNGCQVAWSKSS